MAQFSKLHRTIVKKFLFIFACLISFIQWHAAKAQSPICTTMILHGPYSNECKTTLPLNSVPDDHIATLSFVEQWVGSQGYFNATNVGQGFNQIQAALNVLNPKDPAFGAKGDDSVSDTAAINGAIQTANAIGGGTIKLPTGTYHHFGTDGEIRFLPNVSVEGDPSGNSIIDCDDATSLADCTGNSTGNLATNPIANVTIKNLTFKGRWSTSNHTQGAQVFHMVGALNLMLDNVRVINSRNMCLSISSSNYVTVINSWLNQCVRDGIAVWSTPNALIAFNHIHGANDDAISGHSYDSDPAPVRSGLLIIGNILDESQGINTLGAKRVTIADNSETRMMAYAITASVSGSTGTEGNTAVESLKVLNNAISDVFLRSEPSPRNQSQFYIRVFGGPATTGGAAGAPGQPDGAGNIVSLYGPDGPGNFYSNNTNLSTTASPGGYYLEVVGNTLTRTLPAVAAYSDWGINQTLFVGSNGTNGNYDGPIPESALNTNGIYIGATIHKGLIARNIVSTTGADCIYIDPTTSQNNLDYADLDVVNNRCYNFSQSGLQGPTASVNERVFVDNNLFDADPLMVSPNRGPGGTWLTGTASSVPRGLWITAVTGFTIGPGNRYRNLAVPIDSPTYGNPTSKQTIYVNPVATGFSTGNVGVGFVPPGWNYVIEDGNPSSATFGQTLPQCPQFASAEPTNGTCVQGQFVWNTTFTIVNGSVVLGWARLTTGTGNAAGVDWQVAYSASGAAVASGQVPVSNGAGYSAFPFTPGNWVPSITFDTPGDLSVVYSTDAGRYTTSPGGLLCVQFAVRFTPTLIVSHHVV